MDEPFWWDAPIRWTTFTVRKRVLCDDCVLLLHEQGGSGPAPAQASRKRTSGQGKHLQDTLLCRTHAQQWRAEQDRRAQ
jgi:hypothetical protein